MTKEKIKVYGTEHEVLATEVIREARRQTERWIRAFMLVLTLLVVSNGAWLIYWMR